MCVLEMNGLLPMVLVRHCRHRSSTSIFRASGRPLLFFLAAMFSIPASAETLSAWIETNCKRDTGSLLATLELLQIDSNDEMTYLYKSQRDGEVATDLTTKNENVTISESGRVVQFSRRGGREEGLTDEPLRAAGDCEVVAERLAVLLGREGDGSKWDIQRQDVPGPGYLFRQQKKALGLYYITGLIVEMDATDCAIRWFGSISSQEPEVTEKSLLLTPEIAMEAAAADWTKNGARKAEPRTCTLEFKTAEIPGTGGGIAGRSEVRLVYTVVGVEIVLNGNTESESRLMARVDAQTGEILYSTNAK